MIVANLVYMVAVSTEPAAWEGGTGPGAAEDTVLVRLGTQDAERLVAMDALNAAGAEPAPL